MIDVTLLEIENLFMIQFTGPGPAGVLTASSTRRFLWAPGCVMGRELKHFTKLCLLIFPDFSFHSLMVPLLHLDPVFILSSCSIILNFIQISDPGSAFVFIYLLKAMIWVDIRMRCVLCQWSTCWINIGFSSRLAISCPLFRGIPFCIASFYW